MLRGFPWGQGQKMNISIAGIRTSLRMALTSPAARTGDPEERVEELRQMMSDCLGPSGPSGHAALIRRINASHNASALWYLRPPLMRMMCEIYGEKAARRRIESISCLFEGLLPQGLSSRPSPLSE